MCGIIILTLLSQTYADTTWPMYGATLENTHYQYMCGYMKDSCVVKWKFVTGDDVESYGAAIADVDKDDTSEVIIGSCDFTVYCLNGVTGIPEWEYTTGSYVYSSPAIADVDGDGEIEVVIGSWDNKVYCLNGITGLPEWEYTTGFIVSSPAIADVNLDDTVEVIIGSFDYKVYCLNGITGIPEWEYPTGDYVESSPAIADVDKDDTIEVVIGSWDNKVYCLNGVTGLLEWEYATGNWVSSSPAIADVDGDDTIEVVIGSWDNKVYCLNGVTGLPEWEYTAPSGVHRGIAVADLDMDDKLEVLVPNTGISLICLNGEDGSELWVKELALDVHDPVIGDIDMDGCVEIVVGTQDDNAVWALDDPDDHIGCGSGPGIEERSKRQEVRSKIEFKVMGKGIYLFTSNAVEVDIRVYDVCGRLRKVLYQGVLSQGGHTFIPNIRRNGVYFVVLKAGGFRESIKLINLIY